MESSESKTTDSASLPPVEVRRGAFAQLTIYEVAEYELEILEHGSPDSIYLNFAIFLLILWFRTRKSVSILVKKIRNRLPPVEAFQLSPAEAADVVGEISEERARELLDLMEAEEIPRKRDKLP